MGGDDQTGTGTNGHLDMTMMLVVHNAFRRDLAHLARAASRSPADLDAPARHTAVLAGWEIFKTQLHLHHTGEDTNLWPRMRTRLADRPDDLVLLQAMETPHAPTDPPAARARGLRGGAQVFTGLPDGASPKQSQGVLRGFPPPLRVVYRRIWQPRYA